jgi:hypothetical protein
MWPIPIVISHLIKNYSVIIELKHTDGQTDEQVEKERKNTNIDGRSHMNIKGRRSPVTAPVWPREFQEV